MNSDLDKEIIIEKSKNYSLRVLVILILILTLYFSIIFLLDPAEHTYFLLPTKEVVFVFSILGILTSLLVLFIILKNIFRKNGFIKINEKGVYNGFFLYNKNFINWGEIKNIKTIKYNHNRYVAVFLKNARNDEKGISSLFYNLNMKTMGTPYIINSGDLDCTFEELESAIREGFDRYKRKHS